MINKIDIDEIFKSKNAALYKLLPGFIFSYLKKIIHQAKINSFLERHKSEYDFDFVKGIVNEFGIKLLELKTFLRQEGKFSPAIIRSGHWMQWRF